MPSRPRAALIEALLSGLLLAPFAHAEPASSKDSDEPPPRRDAAQSARDGTFLPMTLSARIGDQRVAAVVYGGYDSAQSQGGALTAVVEGALYRHLAVRVGVDYLSNRPGSAAATAGVRVGILRQERHGIDLGVVALYKQQGFTETTGELEFMVAVARRWSRFALFGNAVYGQGFLSTERDAELRIAALYSFGDRWNLGADARARIDLGDPPAGSRPAAAEAAFDLVAGPTASVALGPVALLAQAGVHALTFDAGGTSVGAIALGGVGASF